MMFIESDYDAAWEIAKYTYMNNVLKLFSHQMINENNQAYCSYNTFTDIDIDFKKFMLWILKNKDGFITPNNVLLWLDSNRIKRGK